MLDYCDYYECLFSYYKMYKRLFPELNYSKCKKHLWDFFYGTEEVFDYNYKYSKENVIEYFFKKIS